MSKWIPVSKRLPENFTPVLVTNGRSAMVAACSEMKEYDTPIWVTFPAAGFVHPTHWMPLPKPPTK